MKIEMKMKMKIERWENSKRHVKLSRTRMEWS
jgi:hypothetical protein